MTSDTKHSKQSLQPSSYIYVSSFTDLPHIPVHRSKICLQNTLGSTTVFQSTYFGHPIQPAEVCPFTRRGGLQHLSVAISDSPGSNLDDHPPFKERLTRGPRRYAELPSFGCLGTRD